MLKSATLWLPMMCIAHGVLLSLHCSPASEWRKTETCFQIRLAKRGNLNETGRRDCVCIRTRLHVGPWPCIIYLVFGHFTFKAKFLEPFSDQWFQADARLKKENIGRVALARQCLHYPKTLESCCQACAWIVCRLAERFTLSNVR